MRVQKERRQRTPRVVDKIPHEVLNEIFPGRIKRTLVSRQVSDQLRRLLLTGKLKTGHRLIQEKIADRFNVSRTTVKSVLSRLQEEGLITRGQRWGWVVK